MKYLFCRILVLFFVLLSLSSMAAENPQYNLSIAAIFKNEAPYFKEWIEYHRLVGVDHFYLYNNGSTDDFHKVLDPYVEENIVTLIDWEDGKLEESEKQDPYAWVIHTQIPAYQNACRERAKGTSKWLALIDVDEFLLPVKASSMTELLEKHENAPGIVLYWEVYGTSGIKKMAPDTLQIEAFHQVCIPGHSLHSCVKTILKPELYSHFVWPPHTVAYTNGQAAIYLNKEEARINHYMNRTVDYFMQCKVPSKEKMINRALSAGEVENWLNIGNEVEDEEHAIHRFVPELKQRLGYSTDSKSPKVELQTSATDNGTYPAFCELAAKDPLKFQEFKRAPFYRNALEHVSEHEGAHYLAAFLKQSPHYAEKLPLFQENDRLGNPITYSYGSVGTFSPTTLRYIKVASDLETLFGKLDNLRIIEIGGGYGGECLVLSKLVKWKSYTLVDLPGPLALTKKYLEEHKVKNVIYKTPEELSSEDSYDLVISNFGFSECKRHVQEQYLKTVLQRASRGYLVCNDFSGVPSYRSFSREELLNQLEEGKKAPQLLPEVPETAYNNYLAIWPRVALPVDVVVFSYDRPMQLYAYLESAEKYMKGINEISIIYRASTPAHDAAYGEVKRRFPRAVFHKQGESPAADFKPLVVASTYSNQSLSPYILYAVDDIIIKDTIDLQKCAAALERTKAWGFFMRLGKNISYSYMMNEPSPCPTVTLLNGGMMQWFFSESQGEWAYPNNVDMTLYRKGDIKHFVYGENYVNPNMFEYNWTRYTDLSKTGLAYEQSKIVNIPLNLSNPSANRYMHSYTTEELLKKFQEGLKIDITPFHGLENASPHEACEPLFVPR